MDTYGIRLINDFGEQTVDFNATHYVTEEGVCTRLNDVFQSSDPPLRLNTYKPEANALGQFRDRNGAVFPFLFASQTPCPSPGAGTLLPIDDPASLFFYKIPSAGITGMQTAVSLVPSFTGVFPRVTPGFAHSDPIPFKRVSPQRPDINPAETHGLQLRDAQGNVTFDSRFRPYGIEDHLIIPQSDMQDVLLNGAVKTYTLRQPVPEAWIHAPFLTSFRYVAQDNQWTTITVPVLFQLDLWTLGLASDFFFRTFDVDASFFVNWWHDTVVLVGA